MSENTRHGESLLQALRLVDEALGDIGKMIEALDEAMGKNDWHPTHKNKATNWLSNTLSPDQWLIPAVYRIYAPQPKPKRAKKIAAVCVMLFPPEGAFSEPMCLMIAARYPKARAYDKIWGDWDYDGNGSDGVLEFLAEKSGPQRLTKALLADRLFPEAEDGLAFAVPLFEIDGTDALRSKIVDPLLEAVEKC